MMHVDSSGFKKSSKNKKKRYMTKKNGGVDKKKAKENSSKGTCFHYVEEAIEREIARPTWSRRRRWHMMHHHLQVFISLRLILFLLTNFRY